MVRAKRGSRNFLKRFIFFFSWTKVAVKLKKDSCTCEQKWDSASTNWPGIYFLRFEGRDVLVVREEFCVEFECSVRGFVFTRSKPRPFA